MSKLVTILIPVHNEQESIPELVSRINNVISGLPQYRWEILMVNDGSTDNSLLLMRQLHAENPQYRYIDLSRNYGKEVAMLAGMDHARGDAVVILDADLQDPPEILPQMIEAWEQGYDDIYARRNDRGRESWLRRVMTRCYYRLLSRLSSTPVLQNVGDFRLLDRRCVDALCSMRESQRYTKGLYSWIGFNKKEITFDRHDRVAGRSKWSLVKLFSLAVEGITSSSTRPLKLASLLGFSISLLAAVYIVWIVIKTLAFGETVQGYPTLMVTILFLGGIQLLTIGIIGEYVGRIFNETKNRPTYFVREIDGIERENDKK
ncbi:MAG: glycosyltransferase family 2 protein [Muribaculaceae bacterium]|nr:glycosyltransferase family 2 protein [Muribaculaceae bacterium]